MSAVVVSSYNKSIPNADTSLFSKDKKVVVDSKVLMLGLYDEMEAFITIHFNLQHRQLTQYVLII